MSATQIHLLRPLAVQKLAAAYRADEIASNVMVMQGGSEFEDIAECVLKVGTSCFPLETFYFVSHRLCEDPNDADAKYVHFFRGYPLGSFSCVCLLRGFHSPGKDRQLAESTKTCVLDELAKAYPRRLDLFRTRGIVRIFRNEYWAAVKDFTHALQ